MIMKKNIFKLFSVMVVSATVLTGCIEEVFPEDSTATSDQIGASATAIEASLNGLPSQMVQGYLVYGKQTHETDLAYPSLMLAQTELLGDVVATDYGYDWWWRFNANNGMNDTGYYSYLPYFTLYKFVKSANDVIAAVDVTDPTITDEMRGLGSIAHAFRALDYYTLMVLFEPVENIYTDCSKVLGLTVPIVTEATTNDIAKSNPRATHEELVNFILADLDKAEIGLESYTPVSKNFPDLAVVYGLKAKVYMWDGQFAKAAEYVFASTQELQTEGNKGSQKVSFKTYFLKTVKRMRSAFDICQPSGNLGEEESALAQCFMAIAGFVRKMSGTSEVDTDTMNRAVSKMVEEALKYNQVESVLESGEEEDIFSPEYFEKLSDVKMPATKLELLIKMLRKQIKEYGKVNQLAAKSFQEMLEKTIAEYHERRKHLTAEEAGETQEKASEDIIRIATEQALAILRQMNENRESFRKIGLTFEEKAFYDILISLRDQYNFEYGTDKEVDGVVVNDKCKALAKKIKDIIDTKSSFADWLNNQNVRNDLKFEIKICLVKNGYPPQYSPEVFNKVMEQVENFEEYSDVSVSIKENAASYSNMYKYISENSMLRVAEESISYGDKK